MAKKKTIKFDFNEAVRKARADFPEETKNITFIDLSLPNGPDELRQWIKEVEQRNEEPILKDLLEKMSNNDSSVCYKDPASGKSVLARNPADCACFSNDNEKGAHFTFDHELGHLIIPEALPAENASENECRLTESIADSFAAIRGIQQGTLDKKDITSISDKRAYTAWLQNVLSHEDANVYMTSYALDRVKSDYNKKALRALSSKEIKDLARGHGQKNKTTPEYALKVLKRKAKKEQPPAPQ